MSPVRRPSRAVRATAAVAGVLAVLSGCGSHAAAPTVRPVVRADGSYRVGSGVGDAASDAAVRAAVAALPAALSYDYRSLDKGLAAATKLMTPAFAATYTKTFDATTRPMATEKQAITSALVRGAGIVGVAGDRATVLIYLDQVLVSSTAKKATDPLRVSQNRVHVTLRHDHGRWLVDDIEPF